MTNKNIANLYTIKNSLLVRVLEESENFKALPENQKPDYISRMAALPDKEQFEMAKYMMKNEKGLSKKILLSFLQHVNNMTEALTNVAAKDKSILSSMRESRKSNPIQ